MNDEIEENELMLAQNFQILKKASYLILEIFSKNTTQDILTNVDVRKLFKFRNL